ncbi:MAG: CotH kinase family protein [Defluviitaleaceae bacterium]|nr:CotH kinase family protein [Defluviitaleaceae bacterium]
MKRTMVLIFIAAVLAVSVVLLSMNPVDLPESPLPPWPVEAPGALSEAEPEASLEVYFSENGHFFPGGYVDVEIYSNNPYAEIFFTTDGSVPTPLGERYVEPVSLERGALGEVVVLRAIATYDGEKTVPVTHTFFLRSDIYERFHENILVFSLTTDPDNLYCFYTGILVEGVTRRDYLAENPHTDVIPTTPANFNWRGREYGERPMHVEVFYPDGQRVLAQDAGVRVFGTWSRAEVVKSLRLIARRSYSPHAGRFNYEFFPGDLMRDEFNEPIAAYRMLVLRNGGNDRNHGILRNELGSALYRRAGGMNVTPVRAAAMFINGEFYGFMWLQTRYDAGYLQEQFGTPGRDFDVVSSGEWWFRHATEEQEIELIFKNSFAWQDLTCDINFALLEEIVDVENLLFYYAFQIFLANADWPHNNLRRWRYTGPPFAGMAPELDGRWRYAVYDLDQTFGLFSSNYRRNTFGHVLENDNDAGQLLRAILRRDDMAELFTIMFCDIAANVVNEEIVREIMDELFADIENEVTHTIEAGGLIADWTSWYSIDRYRYATLEFAERRHIFIFERLARFFEFDGDDMFNVTVTGYDAVIGTIQAESSRYFGHLRIPVTPVPMPNRVFDYWMLNGERIRNERIYVDASMATNGTVTLELAMRPAYPSLIIYSAIEPYGNGVVIKNISDETIRVADLFLSNRREELDRFRLPVATLPSGATLELAGRASQAPGDNFRVRKNFDVREGRRLFLSNESGDILHTLVP